MIKRPKKALAKRAVPHMTPDEIARSLGACRITPHRVDEKIWTSLYEPQVIASINAVEMAVRQGRPVHSAYWHGDMDTQDTVIDWLHMLAADNHHLLPKLPKITWAQAVLHARTWQDAKERQRSGYAGTECTTEILAIGKRRWFRLDTLEAIRKEGRVMRNCLENGDYDDLPGHSGRGEYDGLYSLRDANGHSLVTAMLCHGQIGQAHERANRTVREEFISLLETLANHVRERRERLEETMLKENVGDE